MTSSAPLLAIEGVSRSFAALRAVNGVSLAVPARERRAIIGPNGDRTIRQRTSMARAASATR